MPYAICNILLNFRFRSSFALNFWQGDLTKNFKIILRAIYALCCSTSGSVPVALVLTRHSPHSNMGPTFWVCNLCCILPKDWWWDKRYSKDRLNPAYPFQSNPGLQKFPRWPSSKVVEVLGTIYYPLLIKSHTFKLPSWWLSDWKSLIFVKSINRKHNFLLCKDHLTPN